MKRLITCCALLALASQLSACSSHGYHHAQRDNSISVPIDGHSDPSRSIRVQKD